MKRLVAMAMLAAGTVRSGGAGQGTKTPVRICLGSGGNAATINQGKAAATQILKQASIRLEWRMTESECTTAGGGVVVTVSRATPAALHPDALAYALPYERTHIVLFYDRVLNSVGANTVPALLGHVLAHEIVHILQGVTEHSASGMMKERWTSQDFANMRRGRLRLTQNDLDLIDRGLRWRAGHQDASQYHR